MLMLHNGQADGAIWNETVKTPRQSIVARHIPPSLSLSRPSPLRPLLRVMANSRGGGDGGGDGSGGGGPADPAELCGSSNPSQAAPPQPSSPRPCREIGRATISTHPPSAASSKIPISLLCICPDLGLQGQGSKVHLIGLQDQGSGYEFGQCTAQDCRINMLQHGITSCMQFQGCRVSIVCSFSTVLICYSIVLVLALY